MHPRFVLATVIIQNPRADDEDYDAKLHGQEYRQGKCSIDLWAVSEIEEGWEKGTVVLYYYDGDTRTVVGKFSEWYEKYVGAKSDEHWMFKTPYMN